MAIDNAAWTMVRDTLKALDDPTAEMPADSFAAARLAFAEIEGDVESMIRELQGYRDAEREMRALLENDSPGANPASYRGGRG